MTANTHNGAPYELSEVLLDEFRKLRPHETIGDLDHSIDDLPDNPVEREKKRRQVAYHRAHQLELSALALSGGGIRSASLGLGLIQGLADKNLLHQFNYLSTVSGGGYIGSWLSAWLYHTRDAYRVLAQLRSARVDADDEPPSIEHLRDYSSYLTPKLGLLSADTWAAVAVVLRNMVLNWLILIPAIALPVVAVKLLAVVAHGAPPVRGPWTAALVATMCLVLGSMSLGYKLLRLYSPHKLKNAQTAQRRFLMWSLAPAIIAGALFTWLANQYATRRRLGSSASSRLGIIALVVGDGHLRADHLCRRARCRLFESRPSASS